MKKIVFISHNDISEKRIDLSQKRPILAKRLEEMFRWSKVRHAGSLWEELSLLAHLLGEPPGSMNVWQMPIFSGVYVEHVVKSVAPHVRFKRVNHIDLENSATVWQEIVAFNPDAVFLSTTFHLTAKHLLTSIATIRSHLPDQAIIVGGNFIYKEFSLTPAYPSFVDHLPGNIYLVNAMFGEEEIKTILSDPPPQPITDTGEFKPSGFLYKSIEGKVGYQQTETTAYDINNWPIDYGRLEIAPNLAPFRTASGCSFTCAFCSYPSVGGGVLAKDIQVVIDELKTLQKTGVKQLIILDDTLNVPLPRFKKILGKMVEEGLTDFNIFSFCRCQHLDGEAVELMKSCGFKGVLLGLESGSQTVLTQMKKKTTPGKYHGAIKLLKEAGITTFGAIIIGFPGETLATIEETITFLNSSELDYCYVQPFYYLHNSPVYLDREKYGLEGEGMVWKHNTMTSHDCGKILDDIFARVETPTYANEEYTMWELAYFLFKGYDEVFYHDYRLMINGLRRANINNTDSSEALRHFLEKHCGSTPARD
jgi:anaerobic magnesium-protoporphyrin IX monomethyl ester cyclase